MGEIMRKMYGIVSACLLSRAGKGNVWEIGVFIVIFRESPEEVKWGNGKGGRGAEEGDKLWGRVNGIDMWIKAWY